MHKIYLFFIFVLLSFASFSQNVVWNFGTTAGNANPSTNSATNVMVSAISSGNNLGSPTLLDNGSASSGYTNVSGQYNAGAAARIGALNIGTNGSAYFEFTLTPSASYSVQLTNISFGTRSTGTGPTAYTLRSNSDTYNSDIATGTIAASSNSSWALKTNSPLTTTSGVGVAITFRIYGYGGAGSPSSGTSNWRIDDLSLTLVTNTTSTSPTITLNTTNFNGAFGNVNVGASSTSSSFTVSGSNLTNDIQVTPPTGGFEISTSNTASSFSTASITLAQASGSVAATTIYARFTPTSTGAQSGNITASSTGATDKTVAVSGTGVQPTKLAITAISPASPTANSAFSVTVQAQDGSNTATNVLAATSFTLSKNTGTGTLGGTLTGTIAAGTNQVVVTGVTYNTAETGISLTATQTTGDALAPGNSATFTVLGVATQLVFVNFPASGSANAVVPTFTVEARRADGSVDGGYTGDVTISKASGTGNVTGTLIKAAVAGVATFNDIKFDAADTYTLTAASPGLTSATSSAITIGLAAVAPAAGEIVINQLNARYNTANDEYIELVNVTNKAFNLATVAIRYQSSGGGAGGAGGTLTGTLPPYGYWLLSANSTINVGQTTALARDGSISDGLGDAGQVGLVRISDNLRIDAVGYGATTGSYIEGTSAAAPTNLAGLKRVTDGVDNNTNSTDFTTVSNAAIDLRNSTSRISNAGAAVLAGTYNRLYVTGNSTLGGAITVTGRLVLGNSAVLTTTTTNSLKLSTATTVSGGSSTAYIDGPVIGATNSTTSKLLPIGKAGAYKPVTITPTTTTASEYTAEYFATAPPTAPLESRLNAYQTNEYWQIDRTAGTAPATVTLNYNSTNATWSNGMNPTVSDVIGIVHLRSANNTWTSEGGTTTPNNTMTATLTSGTVTDFSPFTFGYGPSIALPVVLTSFTATKTASGNVLNWKVSAETNFSRYMVERSTSAAGSFEAIATIDASNTGSYKATDEQPAKYNYYRLKLVDKDGKFSYSKTVLVINQAKGFEITNVYPTITTGTVIMESYAAAPVKATIRVVNQAGQAVYIQSVTFNQSGMTNINLNPLAKGNYLLQVQAEGYNRTIKLVKE